MKICFAFLLLLPGFVMAQIPAPAATPVTASFTAPLPPEIEARAYLLMDTTANQVLASKNADQPVEPASLTKLMTAYLVFDALKTKKITLDQRLPVSVRAWKMEGSRMFIDPKMAVRVEELIKGMIVQSGNDATVALAEGVGGSVERFVQLMNERAKLLGMKKTGYKNPEGLTEAGHTTTAEDLAVLATRLLQDFPEYVHYYALQKYRLEGSPKSNDTNRNKLLFRDTTKTGFTVDGLKTGHTDAAGYCLVATSKRADSVAGERRLLSIVLGTASENARANESEKLLVWGYNAFESFKLFDASAAVITPKVWMGTESTVKVGLLHSKAVFVAIPAGTAAQVTSQITRADPLLAPIVRGQPIATAKVAINGQPWQSISLQATQDVALAGWLGRAGDTVRLWFH
jgi:serine-type D-Ala-D-Ala carboxypeptidase (penicillin-binding protein 5/6)